MMVCCDSLRRDHQKQGSGRTSSAISFTDIDRTTEKPQPSQNKCHGTQLQHSRNFMSLVKDQMGYSLFCMLKNLFRANDH